MPKANTDRPVETPVEPTIEWTKIDRAYFAQWTNDRGRNIAQVTRAGSRAAGGGWHWWAYGFGNGDAGTMIDAQAIAEDLIRRGRVRR